MTNAKTWDTFMEQQKQERQAFLVSLASSGMTQSEAARQIEISKQYLQHVLTRNEVRWCGKKWQRNLERKTVEEGAAVLSKITGRDVLRAVALAFDVSQDDLMSRKRARKISQPRQAYFLLCRLRTRLSYPRITRLVNRDHTTALKGVENAASLRAKDAEFAEAIGKADAALVALQAERLPVYRRSVPVFDSVRAA